MSGIFKEVNESLSMADVARHFGYEPNRAGFIKSPFKEERTASCKLYPQSFYDFSSNTGGDIIRFTAEALGLNNWEACRYLIEAFSLPFTLSGAKDNRAEIEKRQRERQRQQVKEQRFKEMWRTEVDRLKTWESIYRRAIERKIFSPLSDLQAYTVAELQKVLYKLDLLCINGGRQEQEEVLTERGYNLGGYD